MWIKFLFRKKIPGYHQLECKPVAADAILTFFGKVVEGEIKKNE